METTFFNEKLHLLLASSRSERAYKTLPILTWPVRVLPVDFPAALRSFDLGWITKDFYTTADEYGKACPGIDDIPLQITTADQSSTRNPVGKSSTSHKP
jgi:hypothetical protein